MTEADAAGSMGRLAALPVTVGLTAVVPAAAWNAVKTTARTTTPSPHLVGSDAFVMISG